MNLRATFEYRPGRVIAVLRIALAVVFLISLVFEPVGPGENILAGLALLCAYLALSAVVAAATWRSWWLDHRLARPLLVVDVAVFLIAVFVTEGYDADFTSPFLAFFALIVLFAMLRWGWRIAARAGVIVSLLFILLGLALIAAHYPIELHRFSRRAFYMVALLLVLVWFGIDRRGAQVPRLAASEDIVGPAQIAEAVLPYAMQITGAREGAMAWCDSDEPWTHIYQLSAGGWSRHSRVGPDALPAWDMLGREARLFDLARGRALVSDAGGWGHAVCPAHPISLAAQAGIAEGLALPLSFSNREGLLVLGGIVGLGSEFLTLGHAIAREIETAADRTTAAVLERESAVIRARAAIARDLHDSVAQSLAGACFRLEALRRGVAGGSFPAPAEEIAAVRDALRAEQAQVRGMIETLRDSSTLPAARPLMSDLARSLSDAAAHWNIVATLSADDHAPIGADVGHELRQLLREAVANAARHGGATEVRASLCRADNGLQLVIADNGAGFQGNAGDAPWSISERVTALGGRLEVHSGRTGTRLAISLPLAIPAEPLT